MNVPKVDIKQLLEAGVHLGHKTLRWNPKMKKFIFGEKNSIHIIDLTQTVEFLKTALVEVHKVISAGGKLLIVSTKKQASEQIKDLANETGQYFVNYRWLGGMLTNWNTIQNSIKRLKKIKNVLMLAESDGYHTGGFELIELFDMSYNWSGHHVLNRIYKKENNSEDLKLNINRNLNDYSSKHVLMNFTSNHDENTWAGTVFNRYGDGAKTFAALTYFLPGIPLIYNGQEYGLNKRLEFFEKDFITKKQTDFYEFYSNLNSLKKENNLLDIDSEIKFEIIETNNKNLICYKRTKNNDSMYFVANLSEESQEINTEFSETLKSLNSDKMISLKKNSLDPWEYHFLK